MHLHTLAPAKGARKHRKRVGRGPGAGGGTTAGRGTKGQRSRSSGTWHPNFEGGQMPLLFRQPKLPGFRSPRRVAYEVVNLCDLEAKLEPGSYDKAALRCKRLLRTKRRVKVLGRGEVTKKFELSVDAVSKVAREALEKAGGTVTIAK